MFPLYIPKLYKINPENKQLRIKCLINININQTFRNKNKNSQPKQISNKIKVDIKAFL